MPKIVKFIDYGSMILTFLLALASFTLSYRALEALALETRAIDPALAWLFPLLLEGAVIIFSFGVLRANILGEDARASWLLTVLFSGSSIAFNYYHAPEDSLAQIVSVVPPLALLLAFKQAMSQIKGSVKRQALTLTLSDLDRQRQEAEAEEAGLLDKLAKLQDKLQAGEDKLAELRRDISEAKKEQKEAQSQTSPSIVPPRDKAGQAIQDKIAQRRAFVLELLEGGQDKQQIAETLDVSVKTIQRDIKSLNGRVAISEER